MFDFEKIVIWGYKIRSLNQYVHTHEWIHQGFYEGFKKMGYQTHWFDDKDDPKMDFKKTLFLTMGNEENLKMPCRNDCFYIFHNTNNVTSYIEKGVIRKHIMTLQVYTHDCKTRDLQRLLPDDPFQLYNIKNQIVYFPWATDLFPEEILENIKYIKKLPVKQEVNFVGMIIQPWYKFARACGKKGIKFHKVGGYDKRKVTAKDNQKLVQKSFMAPSIVCKFQEDKGYIPCRIFKNISYGKYGITNSATVNEYFFKELIYNSDVEKLFQEAYQKVRNGGIDWVKLEKHMKYVAERHTYLNRCQTLLDIFDKIILYKYKEEEDIK